VFGLGPHAGYIVAAYAVVVAVLVVMGVWVVADERRQRRLLDDLEARGVRRRSASGASKRGEAA
jgi:heme exporter protein D